MPSLCFPPIAGHQPTNTASSTFQALPKKSVATTHANQTTPDVEEMERKMQMQARRPSLPALPQLPRANEKERSQLSARRISLPFKGSTSPKASGSKQKQAPPLPAPVAPRPSDRRDLDMVAQRLIRQEERQAIRKAQETELVGFHQSIVRQRGFQLRASQLLLTESRLFQQQQQQRRNGQRESLSATFTPVDGNGRTLVHEQESDAKLLGTPTPSSQRQAAPVTMVGEEPVQKFSPAWYRLVREDISLLLFDQNRNYSSSVRQQLAEMDLFA
jgi:hypothetical protein